MAIRVVSKEQRKKRIIANIAEETTDNSSALVTKILDYNRLVRGMWTSPEVPPPGVLWSQEDINDFADAYAAHIPTFNREQWLADIANPKTKVFVVSVDLNRLPLHNESGSVIRRLDEGTDAERSIELLVKAETVEHLWELVREWLEKLDQTLEASLGDDKDVSDFSDITTFNRYMDSRSRSKPKCRKKGK